MGGGGADIADQDRAGECAGAGSQVGAGSRVLLTDVAFCGAGEPRYAEGGDGAGGAGAGVRGPDARKSGAGQKSGAVAVTITKGLSARAAGDHAGGVLPRRDRSPDAVKDDEHSDLTSPMTWITYAEDLARRA